MIKRSTLGSSIRWAAQASLIACALAGCDDGRSASDQLDPWVDKTITLAPQGPRERDQALVFTTNLEFVVVRKLDVPRTICRSSSGEGGTETVTTEVLEENCTPQPDGTSRCEETDTPKTREIETEVSVPGETQTICEEQKKMDVPRISRVTAIVKPSRAGARIDPGAVHEVVLGFHAKQVLREALAKDDGQNERPPGLERLRADDDLLVSLKASGLKLTGLHVQLGDGSRFHPGDEITIEAVVDPALGFSWTTLGTKDSLPEFKSEEEPNS
jgi:hypothetical protein